MKYDRTEQRSAAIDQPGLVKRYVISALIAGAIAAVSGIAFFVGLSRSMEWLAVSVYPLLLLGLVLSFLLGLGSGAHGAVIHTDVAQYVLNFLVWWAIFFFAGGYVGEARRRNRTLPGHRPE